MESLPSSWRSGSLTFVSPEDHQHHSSVPPLPATTNCPATNTTTSSRTRLHFLSSELIVQHRKKMAKILLATFAILVATVLVGVVISDSVPESQQQPGRSKLRAAAAPGADETGSDNPQQQPERSRLRAKSLSARKSRRPNSARGNIPETTTGAPIDENGAYSSQLLRDDGAAEIVTSTTAKPRSKKNTKSAPSRPVLDSSAPVPEGCGECDMTTCKSYTEKSCQAGLVMDRCSCCFICGSGEGNRCYNASVPNLPYTTDVGMCGTGLACILRKDLDPNEPKEALCECRDRRLVCGNDNHTYSNECKLREAAYKSPGLSIASWGPCVSAPWIPTSIENITVADGEEASLSCEVKGFPSPIIHWEFLVHGPNSAAKILPGDDSSVVVTVRGGPEQTMSTSWIQIIAVTGERQGTYICVATNSHGVARNYATVLISGDRQETAYGGRS